MISFYYPYKCNIDKSIKIINKPFETVEVTVSLIQFKLGNTDEFKINRITKISGINFRNAGIILSGDWDLARTNISDLSAYIALKERFLDKKKWEDTEYYRKFHLNLERNKGVKRGCKSWREYKNKHLLRWEKLFEDIKHNGYKSQKRLLNYNEDEIQVCISRYGEILLIDGRHRLVMAKLLKIESIPVIVNIWHKDYIDKIGIEKNLLTPQKAIKAALTNDDLVYT